MSEPFDSSRRGLPAYPTQPMQVMPPMPALPDLPPAPGDDGLEIRKYLNGLRRRWPLVLACLVIASTYALIRYSLTTKEYMSTTIIQIERKRLSLVALGQAGWLEDWWNLEYYPTQYRLLRSRGMAERVVHNLRLYENPAFTGRPAEPPSEDGEVETPTSEIEVARLAAQVQGGLDVKPIRETQLVEISFRSTVPELAAQIADAYAHAFIEWGIETRSTTVGQAASYISDQINTLNQEIEDRQKLLDSLAGDSEFGLDPEGGALIERQNTLEVQHNKVLSERIGLEAAYNGILSLAEETVANTSSGGRVSELKSELFLLESDYQTKLSTFLPTWPEMVDRKKEIEDKRGQLERLISEKYNEAKDRAYSELQKARREEQSLEDELRRLNADARLKNSSAIEYANHKTYIEHRKELRDDLLKRQSETEMASRTQTTQESNVSIVDSAIIPTQPFRPSLRSGLTQALFVGLLLGFGGIFLLEVMDRTIKSPEELESILGYPTLAVVPDMAEEGKGSGIMGRYIKGAYGYGYGYGYSYGGRSGAGSKRLGRERKKKTADGNEPKREIELLPHKNPKLAVCEAYRSLRTALLLSSAEELRIVAVTSAEPGEGKTATTCNLGVVFAQLGRRVLIVDADLRRPRMHKVFKVSNRLGVVNYLTGKIEIESLFIDTGVPNLFICPSGPIPPNPSELLASDRLRDFLTQVRARFDFVLIDTPPTLPVADAVILGPLTDGLVLCARAGELLRDDAKLCRERLGYEGLRIFGTVLNRYSTSPSRYNRRYRYYGYGAYEESNPPKAHSAA